MVHSFGFATEHPRWIRSGAAAAVLHHLGHPVIFSDEVRQAPTGHLALTFFPPGMTNDDVRNLPGIPLAAPDVIVLVADYAEHVGRRAIREATAAGQLVVVDIEREPYDRGTRHNRQKAANAATLTVCATVDLAAWIGDKRNTIVVPDWTEDATVDWTAVLDKLGLPARHSDSP